MFLCSGPPDVFLTNRADELKKIESKVKKVWKFSLGQAFDHVIHCH